MSPIDDSLTHFGSVGRHVMTASVRFWAEAMAPKIAGLIGLDPMGVGRHSV
jgi:hypothetical protein